MFTAARLLLLHRLVRVDSLKTTVHLHRAVLPPHFRCHYQRYCRALTRVVLSLPSRCWHYRRIHSLANVFLVSLRHVVIAHSMSFGFLTSSRFECCLLPSFLFLVSSPPFRLLVFSFVFSLLLSLTSSYLRTSP